MLPQNKFKNSRANNTNNTFDINTSKNTTDTFDTFNISFPLLISIPIKIQIKIQ